MDVDNLVCGQLVKKRNKAKTAWQACLLVVDDDSLFNLITRAQNQPPEMRGRKELGNGQKPFLLESSLSRANVSSAHSVQQAQ